MAITANTVPTEPTIAYSPVVYELESNSVNIDYIIVEVAVDVNPFSSPVRVSAMTVSADLGTTDKFTFDLQEVLKDNVGFILKTLGSSTIINDEDVKAFTIKAYEANLVAGLIVTNYDPSDDNNLSYDYLGTTTVFFNWRESHMSLALFDINDYQLIDDTKKFLTESTNPKSIELGQNEFLGMAWTVDSGGSKNYIIEVLTYDVTGALLNTDAIQVTEWNEFVVNAKIDPYLDVPIGTANLIAAGVSLTNVAYYTIQLVNDDGDASELRRYNIVDGCSTDVRIHFVNKFGKQDSITLKGNQIEGMETKATTYQKALGLTYDASAFGRAVVQNTVNRSYTAYSKTIGRAELAFANSMLVNNMAWMEVDGNYFSILIEDGSRLVRNEEDMITQFRLNFSLANQERGHKG